jgi:hypothetical protein
VGPANSLLCLCLLRNDGSRRLQLERQLGAHVVGEIPLGSDFEERITVMELEEGGED